MVADKTLEPTLRDGWRRVAKRVFDVLLASILLLLTFAVLVITVPLLAKLCRGASLSEFPALLWAAPIAAGTVLLVARGRFERVLLGAGVVVGVLVVAVT